MDDNQIELLFKVLNFGIPCLLIYFYKVSNPKKPYLLIGAFGNLPLLLFFAWVTIEFHLRGVTKGPDTFAYYAMWVMAGWLGPVLNFAGLAIGKLIYWGIQIAKQA